MSSCTSYLTARIPKGSVEIHYIAVLSENAGVEKRQVERKEEDFLKALQ